MNDIEIFAKKVDEVLELMLEEKLPKDIDDTLLEKLLGVFREGCFSSSCKNESVKKIRYDFDREKTAYFRDLLDKTTVLSFLKKALCSLQGSGTKLSISVETFALCLLGVFVEQPQIFLLAEIQTLLVFLNEAYVKEINSLSPSTRVALLSCMTSIAQHDEGIAWLVQKGVLGTAYSSFSGSTYFIRKNAVNFFTTVLVSWSNSSLFHAKSSADISISQSINNFIEHFVSGLQASHDTESKYIISECCISVLRLAMEKSQELHSLLCEKFHLSSKVLNVLKCTLTEKEPQESIVELLVESLTCSASNNSIVMEVLQVFLQHKFVSSVIAFLSSLLLRQCTNEVVKPVRKDQLVFVMWPIVTLSNVSVSCAPPEEKFVKMLTHLMADNNICIKLVRMSLVALSKLAHLLDIEMLSCIVNASVEVLHHTMTKEVQSPMQLNITGNKKVQVSTLQFFSAMIEEPVCQKLTSSINLQLMDSLISAVENPASDSNVSENV